MLRLPLARRWIGSALILFATPTSSRAELEPPLYPDPESPRNGHGKPKFLRANGKVVPNAYSVVVSFLVMDHAIDALVPELVARHNVRLTRFLGDRSFVIEGSVSNARELSGEPQVQSVVEVDEARAKLWERPKGFVRSQNPIANSYVVTLPMTTKRWTAERVREDAARLTATYGGTVTRLFGSSASFQLNASEDSARAMAEDAGVESVSEDEPSSGSWN